MLCVEPCIHKSIVYEGIEDEDDVDEYKGAWMHHIVNMQQDHKCLKYALSILIACGADQTALDSKWETVWTTIREVHHMYYQTYIADLRTLSNELKVSVNK